MDQLVDLSQIVYRHKNERDLERVALLSLIKSHSEFTSYLDVGAHWSWQHYAPEVRSLTKYKRYDAIDLLNDPTTAGFVNHYYKGNVLTTKLPQYDFVFSISSIEHSGISTYDVADGWEKERHRVFKRLFGLADKMLFLTFPFGQHALEPGQFANITPEDLTKLRIICNGFPIRTWFYFSEGQDPFSPYQKVSEAEASRVEYLPEKGTRCVCFLLVTKGEGG